MDANPVIFDISSDEEGEVGAESNGDNYDWISQLLRDAEGEAESDDVMVLGEVSSRFVNPTNMCNSGMKSKDDVDDDCVVLDGDPDNPTSVVNGSPSGSDELLVVGEKGQVLVLLNSILVKLFSVNWLYNLIQNLLQSAGFTLILIVRFT